MNYKVKVPKSIRQRIARLEISPVLRLELYNALHDLETGYEDKCVRYASPSEVLILPIFFRDDVTPISAHFFTVYLTYPDKNGVLVVRDIQHHKEDVYDPDAGAE